MAAGATITGSGAGICLSKRLLRLRGPGPKSRRARVQQAVPRRRGGEQALRRSRTFPRSQAPTRRERSSVAVSGRHSGKGANGASARVSISKSPPSAAASSDSRRIAGIFDRLRARAAAIATPPTAASATPAFRTFPLGVHRPPRFARQARSDRRRSRPWSRALHPRVARRPPRRCLRARNCGPGPDGGGDDDGFPPRRFRRPRHFPRTASTSAASASRLPRRNRLRFGLADRLGILDRTARIEAANRVARHPAAGSPRSSA